MATWKRASGEPVTTEREVRVYNVETGEEGYVGVSRELDRAHNCRFYGPVCKVERVYDEHGAEVAEPKRTVLDAKPTFA